MQPLAPIQPDQDEVQLCLRNIHQRAQKLQNQFAKQGVTQLDWDFLASLPTDILEEVLSEQEGRRFTRGQRPYNFSSQLIIHSSRRARRGSQAANRGALGPPSELSDEIESDSIDCPGPPTL